MSQRAQNSHLKVIMVQLVLRTEREAKYFFTADKTTGGECNFDGRNSAIFARKSLHRNTSILFGKTDLISTDFIVKVFGKTPRG